MKKNSLSIHLITNYSMNLLKLLLPVMVTVSLHQNIIAQDTTKAVKDTSSLMNQLENESGGNKTVYTASTFGYTHIINGQSVENLPANVLDVRISHRFGPLNQGLYNFLGLDYSAFDVRIGFDYGITNNLMIGVGHSGWQKTYDGFLKLKILKQSEGAVNMPVTVSFVPTVSINTLKAGDFGFDPTDSTASKDKVSYVLQLLIARKFSEGFSLQMMPTYIRADNVSFNHYKNNTYNRDIVAVGIAARQKISKRMSINAEYYYQLSGTQSSIADNSASVGLEIGTGGHVFQLLFTNALGITEKSFISETDKNGNKNDGFEKNGIRFGFNISRVFQLGKKHKDNKSKDWEKK
jgi:hypothetical protein